MTVELTSLSRHLSTKAMTSNNQPNKVPEAESIRVVIQSRPLLPFELAHNAQQSLQIHETPPSITISRPRGIPTFSSSVNNNNHTHFSSFDAVYDAEAGSKPDSLYEIHVSPLIQSLFLGINATVFAYGQTCAGKSYTMRHVTTRVVNHIFEQKRNIEEQGSCHINVRVAFVEIYRESIRDLVDGTSAPLGSVHVNLRTRSTTTAVHNNSNNNNVSPGVKRGAVFLDGARERCVEDEKSLLDIIEEGALVRRTAATGMNASSSRSHSIITISIMQQPLQSQNQQQCLSSKIHLVDLTGSERAKRTAAGGERFAEGVDINKGLFALAKVISTLADNSRKPASKRAHVPYRDSKLTRLLQDSLGGSSRTLLVACVSPADSSVEETLGTLRYAERAKQIKNKPKINTAVNAVEVSDLRAALSCARAEIAALAADNERLRNNSSLYNNNNNNISCPNCGICVNENINNDNDNDAVMTIRKCRTATKTMSKSNRTNFQKSKTINNSPTLLQPQRPKRVASTRRLPRRVAATNSRHASAMRTLTGTSTSTFRRGRSPSVIASARRRSKSASGLRINNRCKSLRNVMDLDNNNTSMSPRTRSDTRRKRLRPTTTSSSSSPSSTCSSSSMEEEQGDEQDDDEDNATAKALGRQVASTLSETRFEEMRRTFTERLQQAMDDKHQIDVNYHILLRTTRECTELHERQIEQLKLTHISRVQTLRAKLSDVKRLEAESTRLTKLRDGDDMARKKLQGRVLAAEKARDEMVSRLSEALSKTEVSKLHLGKENRVLIRSERQLRLELQRAVEGRAKFENMLMKIKAENEVLKSRISIINTPHNTTSNTPSTAMRRVNSSYISTHHLRQQHKAFRD